VTGVLERGGAGAEVAPASVDMDPALVEAAARCARDKLARRGAAGQLVVLRRGQVVLDRAFGAGQTSLLLAFSITKPYTALLVMQLAERGLISLDEPVAAHWPEFGRHGKQAITPRMLLTHRAGVPDDSWAFSLAAAGSWPASVRRMEALVPSFPPGEVTAYHSLTFGWILGELARRVTGEPVDRLLSRAVLEPLGARDSFLGLPDRHRARAVPLRSAGGRYELATAWVFNRRRQRRAVAPAATLSATARDVARFFEMLRRGGELDGARLARPATIAEMVRPATPEPVLDRRIGSRVRCALGLHLGGVTSPQDGARRFGELSSPEAFGHTGANCCTAWADPTRELAFAYLTGLLLPAEATKVHQSLVSDCVIRACG
jgi:CubicO group peptidase (beta-lactamase class C family)